MIENDQLWWILTDYDRFWPIMIDTDRYWPIMIDFDRLWSILTDVYHGSDLIKNRKVRIINLPLRKYGHYPISRGLQSFAASADKLGCVSTASEGFLSSSLTIIIKAAVLNERSRTRTNKKMMNWVPLQLFLALCDYEICTKKNGTRKAPTHFTVCVLPQKIGPFTISHLYQGNTKLNVFRQVLISKEFFCFDLEELSSDAHGTIHFRTALSFWVLFW